MKKKKSSNELEFQGVLLNWLNLEIRKRPGMGLDQATQEKPAISSSKRSDLIVWKDRKSESAFLEIELKTPETSITDPNLLRDALNKAQSWKAPYFVIWNMREAELYKTPPVGMSVSPDKVLKAWPSNNQIRSIDDWLCDANKFSLETRALDILDSCWSFDADADSHKINLDSTVFVDKLSNVIDILRSEVYSYLTKAARTNKQLRNELNRIAAKQGFIGFVQDIEHAISGQYGYRLIGQILFYFALRRKQPLLKEIKLDNNDNIPEALRPYWDDVRRYDYDALFKPDRLDEIIVLSIRAQYLIKDLISQLSGYDWNSLKDDVLGSIFENLIPTAEQHLLGQFYTPRPVADLLVTMAIDGERPTILDPGCGSGTFLMSAYDYLFHNYHLEHQDILSIVWGFDLSPFATELAAINLFRQDLNSFDNFPRIVPGDFFTRKCGEKVLFPPPNTVNFEKKEVPIPIFDAIVGNPPYLRSQNQDDLDPDYKARLNSSAISIGVKPAAKTDLFLYFIYHALNFMQPGSRLAFVTSSSWLTADFSLPFKKLLFDKLKLIAIITSSAESFFSQVDINATLIVVEKRDTPGMTKGEHLRFVNLKKPLREIFNNTQKYWKDLTEFSDKVESLSTSTDNDIYRLLLIDSAKEKAKLYSSSKTHNWSIYTRAPISYFKIYGET